MNNVLNYKFPEKPLSTNEFPDYADQSFSLYSILAGVSRELYIIDVHNFHFISASVSALENLGVSLQELRDLRVRDVFSDITHEFLAEELAKHSSKLSVVTELISQQGISSSFDTTLKLVYVKEQYKEVLIAIRGSDHEALAGTQQIHNIVSNIPSLVFEISLSPSNQITFNFLSEGCDALLGISRGTLLMRPDKFIELMRPQDRQSFMLSMKRSAKNLSIWNWEGGLWIEQWQDVKLINLRASAKLDAQGNVRWHGVITNITHSKNEKTELNKIISRFKTIVSNIPSLVFECTQNDNQQITFNYLNEGCHALLDIAPEELKANPQQLLEM
ncbi:MAG: hypothetical protein Q8J65_05920, partial [Nitrosomonadales bacterium]|nr:hypothetical protein [Nitrosomonadales bacterium]